MTGEAEDGHRGKVALVCPGQGAQRPGGVNDLPDSARAVFDRASALIGVDLWKMGLEGEAEALAMPSVLQPFLVAWAVADYEWGRSEQPELRAVDSIDYCMGHSSGENSALVLSGALSFEDGVRFAHERGKHLDTACETGSHGLMALAGLERAQAETFAAENELALANHNASTQTVLGGERAALERALGHIGGEGVDGVVLRVAGAFHTEAFRRADEMTEPMLGELPVAERFIPLIGNARGQLIRDAVGVREELSMQYTRPIEWVAAMETAYAEGVRTFVVMGPGNAMNGLVRRFGRTVEDRLTTIRLNRGAAHT